MDVKDADYFNQSLQIRMAYKISGFSYEDTSQWERTLQNCTSLIFGRHTELHEISNIGFLEHYFKFAAYNRLAGRANVKNAVFTSIDVMFTGDATTNRIYRHTIDIQNLSGNIIGLTLWNDMATNFNIHEYGSMEKPVVIVVSSYWVSRYSGLQLSGTSATHCYLDPNIPETYQIKHLHEQVTDTTPIQNVNNQRYEDSEQEKTRNCFPLAVLLEVYPQNYQRVRFTSKASIYKINTQKSGTTKNAQLTERKSY
ncbi:nucleic acid-binding, OB-fold protein [Tanacetum coccineum]